MYLSVNHLCFYSFLLGKEARVVLAWIDVAVRINVFNVLSHLSLPIATHRLLFEFFVFDVLIAADVV